MPSTQSYTQRSVVEKTCHRLIIQGTILLEMSIEPRGNPSTSLYVFPLSGVCPLVLPLPPQTHIQTARRSCLRFLWNQLWPVLKSNTIWSPSTWNVLIDQFRSLDKLCIATTSARTPLQPLSALHHGSCQLTLYLRELREPSSSHLHFLIWHYLVTIHINNCTSIKRYVYRKSSSLHNKVKNQCVLGAFQTSPRHLVVLSIWSLLCLRSRIFWKLYWGFLVIRFLFLKSERVHCMLCKFKLRTYTLSNFLKHPAFVIRA